MTDDNVYEKAKRGISAQIPPNVYLAGKKSGVKWGYLIEMGLEARDLRLERNRLLKDIEKLQRANAQLQTLLLKAQEARDRAVAETGG